MKKLLFIPVLFLAFNTLMAQHRTKLITTGIENAAFRGKIERTFSNLLTAFNYACAYNSPLDLSEFDIDDDAKKTIEMLWNNSPFRCEDTDCEKPVLRLYNGTEYEIRTIPLIFTNMGNEYHDVAITFDNQVKITSFHITIAQHQIGEILDKKLPVSDLRRRQIIVDYVEQFRTAYNTKDLNFMNQVFSDDALIIVGRNVIVRRGDNVRPTTHTEFYKKSKQQYLNDLRRVFNNNKTIHIEFEDVKVMAHPTKKDWYGVQLKQDYRSDKYSDLGYLFLLWDFTAGDDKPQIHVRTWQPDKDGFGRQISEDEIFGFDDVNIY